MCLNLTIYAIKLLAPFDKKKKYFNFMPDTYYYFIFLDLLLERYYEYAKKFEAHVYPDVLSIFDWLFL